MANEEAWKPEWVDWARDVVIYATLPYEQQLAFDESMKIAADRAIDSLELFEDCKDLETTLQLIEGHARKLWIAFQKTKSQENKPTPPILLSFESQFEILTIDTPMQRDNDEKLMAIQLLINSMGKPPRPESMKDDHTMPFKDRAREAEILRQSIQNNLIAYNTNSRRKNDYYFTTVTSGTGFGKTRFCLEIPDPYPSNGDRIDDWLVDRDEYTKNSNMYLENLLGRRIAAHAFGDCNYKDLLALLHREDKMDSLPLLTFDAVLKTIGKQHGSTTKKPMGVVLILDEINYWFKYAKLAHAVINMIENYMTGDTRSQQRDAGVILFPVISGTAVNGVAESFVSSSFGKCPIPLGLLSLDGSKSIFSHCLPTKQHWLNDKRITRLLLLYGNTPAVLRRIIQRLKGTDNTLTDNAVNSLIESLEAEVASTEVNIPGLDVTHLDVVLAGFAADPTIAKAFQSLENNGMVYVLNGIYMLPYVYLRAVNRVIATIPPKLLPAPGLEYSWSDFEKLEHALQGVRIRVFLDFNSSAIKLHKLFRGAHHMKSATEIRLQSCTAVTCIEKLLIKKEDKLDLSYIEIVMNDNSVVKAMPSSYFQYCFLAAPGNALFDIVEFYKSTTNQRIVLFKQMKHLENSENSKTIGPKLIEAWLNQMRASTCDLTNYECYYMLITNKRVPSARSLVAQHTDLVIVDQSNLIDYYGPTVATFADLVSLDDAIASNSEY